MDSTLEAALKENYPVLFEYLNEVPEGMDVPYTISLYGIQCNDGWYRLVDSLAAQIENTFNNNEDVPDVKAVQVKEKFAGLRFYTDKSPEGLHPLIRFTERLSKQTCEICGDMGSGRVRDSIRGRFKTLCDTHYYSTLEVPEDIEIWRFETECFECEEMTPVVYPRPLGGTEGGSWSAVGAELETRDYANVERIFSETQNMFVWGNRCTSCDVYIGNYFIWKEVQSLPFSEDGSKMEHVETIPRIE